jgi:4-amino-4-deoxy-L-arabinose transferase-like glycosyltransferase
MTEDPKQPQDSPWDPNYTLPVGGGDAEWTRPKGEWWVRLLVLAVAMAIFLPNVGAFGLWDPWETHYGEVTRNMVETHDWVSPYWGYRSKIGPKQQGAPFFSKPILIFWTEATAVKTIGMSDWAIRLPMAVMAIMAMFMAYLAFSRIRSRRAGLLAAAILGTAPQFFYIGRQAQTDMPFVSTLTVALLAFMIAVFGPRERPSNRGFLLKVGAGVLLLLGSTVFQYGIIATDLFTEQVPQDLWARVKLNGIYHVAVYGLLELALLGWVLGSLIRHRMKNGTWTDAFKDRWIRNTWLLVFYVFCGHSSLGKGLLGFMLPGAVLFVWILATNRWRMLKDLWIPLGIVAFILVGVPWYMAMFAKHGNAFYSRFFIHDHFNRLGTGVHEIDSGTFEHFLRWLGVGLFPWVAFLPLVLVKLSKLRLRLETRENQTELFLFVWFFVAYLLFTLASTKFHHYIFPALPPLAFLLGLHLVEHLKDRSALPRLAAVVGLGVLLAVGWHIHDDPQSFRNLFTYKYDRPLPQHLPLDASAPTTDDKPMDCATDADCLTGKVCGDEGTCSDTWETSQFYQHTTASVRWLLQRPALEFDTFTLFLLGIGGLSLLLFIFRRSRGAAVVVMLVAGFSSAAWGLNYYLPSLSPHWSQKYVFEEYYDHCGDRLQNREQEAYEPLVRKIGLGFIADWTGATYKRVCPDNISSWLIVWRGETYHSYNELMPLEKKDEQMRPYLEDINPRFERLSEECGGARILCPAPFYVFLENRSSNTASSVASQVKTVAEKIKRDGKAAVKAGYGDLEKYEAEKLHRENDYFTVFKVTPIFSRGDGDAGGEARRCGCGRAEAP